MNLRTARLGPLSARIVEPEAVSSAGPVVVLLHGFGAPGTDLVPLAGHLKVPPGTRFVFPEAPLGLGAAFGHGRAWWMIDMVALQTAMAQGSFRDMAEQVPDGLAESRQMLAELLDAVEKELGATKLALGGFSQGSMLTTDYTLRSDRKIEALVAWSGTVIARAEWEKAAPGRKDLPVFMSHGRMDPVLPYSGAERLRDLLTKSGLQVGFTGFDGVHEIPLPALEGASQLLLKTLA